MARVTLFLAVDDDTYLNWDAVFDEHILIEFGIGFGTNRRTRAIRDGSTYTAAVRDGRTRTRKLSRRTTSTNETTP